MFDGPFRGSDHDTPFIAHHRATASVGEPTPCYDPDPVSLRAKKYVGAHVGGLINYDDLTAKLAGRAQSDHGG
jgi:hypothetical protein